MKLNDILKRNFILPLVISFFISICIAVALSNVFVKSYFNANLQQKLREAEKRKVSPLMDTVEELIYRKIQAVFTDLTIIKKYFTDAESKFPFDDTSSCNDSYYNDYLVNTFYFQGNYTNIVNLENDDDFHYYDKANWFISPSLANCQNITSLLSSSSNYRIILRYLKVFREITPILKVLYHLHKEKDDHRIETFFIANRRTEILYSYPMHPDREPFYQQFGTYTEQKEFCRNKTNEVPKYFYFPCRDWFIQLTQQIAADKSADQNKNYHFISYPYKITSSNNEKKIGTTICISYRNNTLDFSSPFPQDLDDYIMICADLIYENLVKTFDNFNRQLKGYFMILGVNSEYPIYHPGILKDDYYNDITRVEFSIHGRHYIYQVTEFKEKILPILTKEYSENDVYISNNLQPSYSFFDSELTYPNSVTNLNIKTYMKGESLFNFTIFPIFFSQYIDPDTNPSYTKTHLLSLVYIINSTAFDIYKGEYSSKVIYISIIYGLIFFIIGGTLITFSNQLILIFGKNITRPIKDIENRIRRNRDTQISTVNNLTTQGNGPLPNTSNIPKNSSNNNSSANLNDSSATNNPKDDEANALFDEEEEEEEIIPIKNKELTNRFEFILELKNVLLFLQNPKSTSNRNQITRLLSSNNVFNKIQYTVGKEISLSNIGNLTSYCSKYDKAITFLTGSLGLQPEELEDEFIKNFNEYLDSYLKNEDMKHTTTVNNLSYNPLGMNSKINNTIEFTRYLKLFYSYRTFFSGIKRKQHYLDYILSLTKSRYGPLYKFLKGSFMFNSDFYVNNQHHYKTYKRYILICIIKLIKCQDSLKKDEKICYCLLELLHYEINSYKLKAKRANNKTIELNSVDKTKDEENDELFMNNITNEFDKKNEEIKIQSDLKKDILIPATLIKKIASFLEKLKRKFYKNIRENYKSYLYDLHHIENNISSNIHLNYHLLNQRFHYLNAKFNKFKGDYVTAIEYYIRATDDRLLIYDGMFYKKANEKIISILTDAKTHNVVIPLKHIKPNDLIEQCNMKLKTLNSNSKDFVAILDLNEGASKKLQNKMIKTIKNIFENYISTDDRFCLYTFKHNDYFTKMMPLTYKDSQNYPYIISIFDFLYGTINNVDSGTEGIIENDDNKNISESSRILNEEVDEDDLYSEMKMKFAIDAVFNVANELPDKKITKREQYIVLFTECFQSTVNDKVNKDSILEFFKDRTRKNERSKLFIIGNLMAEQEKLSLARDLLKNYFETCDYFEYENYQEIKKLITVMGKFPRGYEFQNEKFDK